MKTINCKKKPVVIQAVHLTNELLENPAECNKLWSFIGKQCDTKNYYINAFGSYAPAMHPLGIFIETLEGIEFAKVGCYIMKGIHGECYPCDEKIFKETYDIIK
jgi:hypothetical protein